MSYVSEMAKNNYLETNSNATIFINMCLCKLSYSLANKRRYYSGGFLLKNPIERNHSHLVMYLHVRSFCSFVVLARYRAYVIGPIFFCVSTITFERINRLTSNFAHLEIGQK